MSQSEIYGLITKEWQSREDIRKKFEKKYCVITDKSFYIQLRKLGLFIEGKYENKKYWYRIRQCREHAVNDYIL